MSVGLLRPSRSDWAVALLIGAMALVGCSSSASNRPHVDLPPGCAAFVQKYETCLAQSIPGAPDIARARAAQTRAALEQEAQRADLGALGAKCQDNLSRLTATCGASRAD